MSTLSDDSHIETSVVIGGCVLLAAVIIGVLYMLFSPKDYTIRVKNIRWDYVIQIQELKQVHEDGWSTPPSNAYNVTSTLKKRGNKVVGKDANGKDITTPDYDTWYEYDIDKWVNTRTVPTYGFDKEPYWGEVTLRSTENPRRLGCEREGKRTQTYTVSGQLVHSDDMNLISIEVPEYIWKSVDIEDEVNYLKSKVGKPYEIHIAE